MPELQNILEQYGKQFTNICKENIKCDRKM